MQSPRGIVWLASYPKSGNTWFRIILSRLLNKTAGLHDINDIDLILGSPMVANRSWMNRALGLDSMLLRPKELEALRPPAYRQYAEQLQKTAYIKLHDAYTFVSKNEPLIPAEGCLSAVYFIRSPLDVAVSLAHHAKCPIDWSIQMMGNPHFTIPFTANSQQLPQKLLTWSQHVTSWESATKIKVLFLRYEDMLMYPDITFKKGMDFLTIPVTDELLHQTIKETSFTKLQQFEQQYGFKEKLGRGENFFRKGIMNDWKNALNKSQINKIIQDHEEVMHTYGYLDKNTIQCASDIHDAEIK